VVDRKTIKIQTGNGRPYQSVSIKFDAQNLYGAVVRTNFSCIYPIDGQDVREDLVEDHDEYLSDALDGAGLFSKNTRMPTRQEQSIKQEAEWEETLRQSRSAIKKAEKLQ